VLIVNVEERMTDNLFPVLFVGHGSPMNAIEENEYSQTWARIGQQLPRPKAILCISAHWETPEPQTTHMDHPKTIHDFYGFPRELNEKQYPAPGSPVLAERIAQLAGSSAVALDNERWGLDHGTWSVLCRMVPQADIPVVQLSLARTRDGQFHYDLAKRLAPLREEGVLILGSGNVVHNLGMISMEEKAYPWAEEFDALVKNDIESGDHDRLIHFQKLGRAAALSINSAEHYLPLLYVLALQRPEDRLQFFCESLMMGSLSMRCVQFGA
jgi:4,5-DOPA dioxygenase extradiol